MNKNTAIFSVIIVLTFCFSCTYDKLDSTCNAPSVVSFSQNIQPIFNQNCSTSGCHSGTSPAGNLSLESSVAYAQLVRKGKGYIDTLTPQYSVLYASMNSTSNPMPPSGKLDKCNIDLVLKWIEQKATNN